MKIVANRSIALAHMRPVHIRSGQMVWMLVLAFACLFSAAHAETAQDLRFAVAQRISGQVTVTNPNTGAARDLKVGDAVYVGEQLATTATAEAVLRTDDAGIIAMRPNARFVMDAFKSEGQKNDVFSLRILTGALRLLTGVIAGRNRDAYRVQTPSATLGVRGTDYEPYVLTKPLAYQFSQKEGTYNKVNQGSTTLEANGTVLEVNSGQTGFAPVPVAGKVRGLMTAVMPVLLDRVPDFYLPGRFDNELAALAKGEQPESSSSGGASENLLRPGAARVQGGTAPAGAPQVAMASHPDNAACRFNAIARRWLRTMDAAIAQRNAQRFMDMFDASASVITRVQDGSGQPQEIRLDRDALARSVITALGDLSDFQSRRPVTHARLAPGSSAKQCNRIELQSLVIESGVRSGTSYRLESVETFTLEKRGGEWLAVEAMSQQH